MNIFRLIQHLLVDQFRLSWVAETAMVASTILGGAGLYQADKQHRYNKRLREEQERKEKSLRAEEAKSKATAARNKLRNARSDQRRRKQRGRMSTILGQQGSYL